MRHGDNVEIKITANAYLHQQIRRIVGVLYDIGRDNSPIDMVDELLASAERGAACNVMPAEGLCLTKIVYNGSGECGLPVYAPIDSVDLGVN
jgi:tRNA pseudouridine38-40 synthase